MKKCQYCGEAVKSPCETAGDAVWFCKNVQFEPYEDYVARNGTIEEQVARWERSRNER